MGMDFDYRIYEGVKKEEAERQFDIAQRESEHRDGTSYSGAIGVMPKGINWSNSVWKSKAQAMHHLEDAHKKWNEAMGVEFLQDDNVCFIIGGWCSS